jgi:hypothetical protein
MHQFIDESGSFIVATGWAVVCSLSLPHKEVGPTRREINRLTLQWPRPSGELKGGRVTSDQLEALVEVLFRHDGLFNVCAMDISREADQSVNAHKAHQCQLMTKYLTAEHDPQVVEQIQNLRHVLEGMSRQLYIQCVMMTALVRTVEQIAMYFAQRRPRELALFEWTIDAKDPQGITTQEEWWRDTLAPMLHSQLRKEPLKMCGDSAFNYSYFIRSFEMEGELWSPDRPSERVQGYKITKLMTERMHFVDSRSEILIQVVDILASFVRRLLAGEITEIDKVAHALGRLQIGWKQQRGPLQSVRVLRLSDPNINRTELIKPFAAMREASRRMLKREPQPR